MNLKPEQILEMYYLMRLSRAFEERLSLLYRQGKITGGIFSGIGQEAIVVGVCYGLRNDDFISPVHRDLGAFLVRGVDPNPLMAQIFGKRTGMSKGKECYLHAGDMSLGIFGGTSMLGSTLPVVTGAALAFKIKKQDRVAVAFFGEGAASRGDTHEAMNFAGVHKLPVIFVCENNRYAYSTPVEKEMAIDDVASRAAGYGFPGKVVSGNDLPAVWDVAQHAIERARKGEGPTLIECKTYRWHGHSEHDAASYRSEEEFIEWRSRDPIPRFEFYLREKKLLTEEVQKDITTRVQAIVDEAIKYAEESPWPEGPEALEDLYTTDAKIT